jgi:hypothetical protein
MKTTPAAVRRDYTTAPIASRSVLDLIRAAEPLEPRSPLSVPTRGALAPLPGVTSARVDIDARTVTIEVDETVTDRARLVAAIEEQGYDVPA